MSRFATTRWSLVLRAGARNDHARAALDELCHAYWYPLYAYARRRGKSQEDAQDSVQGFFTRMLDKGSLSAADPDRGRFRAFLLTAFRNDMSKQHQKEHAVKRGGSAKTISLDGAEGERRYGLEPAHEATPEKIYMRDWALSVLDRALARLRVSYAARDKEVQFDGLKCYLTGDGGGPSHLEKAEELGVRTGAIKVAVFRLRQRFRQAVREEVAQTLPEIDEARVELELRELLAALGGV